MIEFWKQFACRLVAFFLVFSILAPTTVKLYHAIYQHQEQLCIDDSSTHVHEIEFDCDFQKFKLSPQLYPNFVNIHEVELAVVRKNDMNHYSFLNKYQKLHFDLRGPPIS